MLKCLFAKARIDWAFIYSVINANSRSNLTGKYIRIDTEVSYKIIWKGLLLFLLTNLHAQSSLFASIFKCVTLKQSTDFKIFNPNIVMIISPNCEQYVNDNWSRTVAIAKRLRNSTSDVIWHYIYVKRAQLWVVWQTKTGKI